ncbi:hypothetical protein E2562_007064 [Oryza meyeriana var. granulata]|uniref:Thioredoxin domain-containing protein n=1 Tax=Oryza meyeriana var. granulata TaxID=110450 RepID=A0A6G1F4N2_9ORYZ|nr:hypothetical protein E2562_007064 [Oryza meyeriana var. granulata]
MAPAVSASQDTAPPDSTAACWAKEVHELSYDVDDFADELTTQLHCGGDCSSSGTTASKKTNMIARLRGELHRRRWIADEVTWFRARVKEAIRRHESYNLARCTSRPREEDDERRRFLSLTLGMDVHGQLVGRDSMVESLVRWLADGERKRKVGSILGLGGVGKTTVATEIYRLHGRRLESPFECRAFVRTPRKPDMTKILTDMLSQLRPQHQHQSSDCLLHLRLILLELLPDCHNYIFTSIPEWTGKLDKLRILNIAVMKISQDDLDSLKGLAALTALSLHVQTAPAQRIIVGNEGFLALKYFMFVCTAPCMAFVEGAMLSVQRLNLRFNGNEFKQYGFVEPGFEHLVALEEISARIEGADCDESVKMEVESALSQERGGEEMVSIVEGMVAKCRRMEEFAHLMSQAMQSSKLVVIQFAASWCPSSRYMAPIFTEYAKKFVGAAFLTVDVDIRELKSVSRSYGIKGVPTFVFVKNEENIDMIVGPDEDSLRAKIQKHIAAPYFLR